MNETYPVIIIGAGTGAYLSLKYKNIRPIILESTSSIGGRIRQVKLIIESCNNYVMVDIGANWIQQMTNKHRLIKIHHMILHYLI